MYVAEPNPPTGLMLNPEGLALVATWEEPFSLEGEDLSYVITIMNRGNVVQDGITVNTTTYVLSEPIGERNCSEYAFTVFSENSFGRSRIGITGVENIPTGWKISLSLSYNYLPHFSPTLFPHLRLLYFLSSSLLPFCTCMQLGLCVY
jgi:hypothetical protein